MAVWYCHEVISGHVPACKYEIMACKRFLDMKAKASKLDSHYYWSDAVVIDVCSFIEKLPHVKGFEGTIVLEPSQCWWLANIFGFRELHTDLRWIRAVSFWVPRKNAKSTLAVGVSLYCLLHEGEPGAEMTISAGNEAQAHVPYDMIRASFAKEPELKDYYGAWDTQDYTEFRRAGNAKITLASSKAKNLDGLNPHVLFLEELHAQDQAVLGVLRTAMGARKAPLELAISTSGRDTNAPAYVSWRNSQAVLEGRIRSDREFTVLYTADPEDIDHPYDLKVLEKVNPLWGISLNLTSIEKEIREAKQSPENFQEYKRTRINVWSRAAGNLIDIENWDKCQDKKLKLSALKGFPLFVGIDLASTHDLNAAAYLTEVDGCCYEAADYWLPKEAKRLRDERFADAFLRWQEEGYLHLTEGSWVDQKAILHRVLDRLEGHRVIGIGMDRYQADAFAKEIEDRGYQVFMVEKTAKALTQATDDLIGRTLDPKLLQHDGNPITRWCAGNMVGHYDANGNVLAKKEKPNSPANIDGMDAFITANALRMDWNNGVLGLSTAEKLKRKEPNPYKGRGLLDIAI